MLLPLTCLNDAPGDNNNSFYFPLPLLDFLGHIHLHTTVVNFPSIQVSTVHQMYRSLLGVVSSCKKRLIDDLLRTAQIPPENRMFCPHPHCSSLLSRQMCLELSQQTILYAKESGRRICEFCSTFFCVHLSG